MADVFERITARTTSPGPTLRTRPSARFEDHRATRPSTGGDAVDAGPRVVRRATTDRPAERVASEQAVQSQPPQPTEVVENPHVESRRTEPESIAPPPMPAAPTPAPFQDGTAPEPPAHQRETVIEQPAAAPQPETPAPTTLPPHAATQDTPSPTTVARTVDPATLLADHIAPALVTARAVTPGQAQRLLAVPRKEQDRRRTDLLVPVGIDPVEIPAEGDIHVHIDRIIVRPEPAAAQPPPPRPVDHSDYLARQRQRWGR